MHHPYLGNKLSALRTDRGLSIAEVAERTEISASFLSLVENGRSDIAIGRLMRLIGFYGVGLATLFPETQPADIEVVRRDEYVHLVSGDEGLDLVVLSRGEAQSMTPFVAAYEEGGGMAEPTPYEGEAFVYVLEGQVEIDVEDGDTVRLGAGDTAYVRSPARRTYRNAGTGQARLLGVIARPGPARAQGA